MMNRGLSCPCCGEKFLWQDRVLGSVPWIPMKCSYCQGRSRPPIIWVVLQTLIMFVGGGVLALCIPPDPNPNHWRGQSLLSCMPFLILGILCNWIAACFIPLECVNKSEK